MIQMCSLKEVYDFSIKKLVRNRITPAHAETLLLNNNNIEHIYYMISTLVSFSKNSHNRSKEMFSKNKNKKILEIITEDTAQADYIDNIFDSIIMQFLNESNKI
jgi:hypothetical protein